MERLLSASPGQAASKILLVLSALFVTLVQPALSLPVVHDCASCGQEELDAESCCCAPDEAEVTALSAPVEEAGCCSTPEPEEAPGQEPTLDNEHECSCRSTPSGPAPPPPLLPATQDIGAAQGLERMFAQGLRTSQATLDFVSTRAPIPRPAAEFEPRSVHHNPTRLGRASAQGSSVFLSLLSVARL